MPAGRPRRSYHLVDLGATTAAQRVDRYGDVAGATGNYAVAAIYHDGAWIGLNVPANPGGNVAQDISDRGDSVYTIADFDGIIYAEMETHDGHRIDIDMPGGSFGTYPMAVSRDRTVTGDTAILDLSGLVDDLQGLVLGPASSVNDAGVIVGNALLGSERHGYMRVPIRD